MVLLFFHFDVMSSKMWSEIIVVKKIDNRRSKELELVGVWSPF